MKYAQKLVCVILLVLSLSFSLGGCVLLYSDFADRLATAESQNAATHSLACYALETELLSLRSKGDPVDDTALARYASGLTGTKPDAAQYAALLHSGGAAVYSSLPVALSPGDMANGQMAYLRDGAQVYAVYRSDLLDDLTLFSAYDLTGLYTDRTRSLYRYLLLEAVVLVCAAVVAVLASVWLTRPLKLLTRTSAEITAGAYDRRTGIKTQDEIGRLSESFDTMAEAVQEKVGALEESVQQREDFMGAFTHELKTPMTSILGYSDMLRTMQCEPDEQREAAGAIYHEAKRLEDLSQKLLQLLHLSEEPLTLVPTAMAPVLEAMGRAAEPFCRQKKITLDAPVCTATVRGNAELLVDLLLNLVHNAAKASEPGQTVRVTCLPDEEKKRLTVTVSDDGCGIPPEQISRLTEPFYMVDKSRARQNGGSGLGLALSQKIAVAHGTVLTITSVQGRGTQVSFTLMLTAPAPETEEEVSAE